MNKADIVDVLTAVRAGDNRTVGQGDVEMWFQVIGDYKLLVYGGLLFLMMRFAPGGLAGIVADLFRSRQTTVEGARP